MCIIHIGGKMGITKIAKILMEKDRNQPLGKPAINKMLVAFLYGDLKDVFSWLRDWIIYRITGKY